MAAPRPRPRPAPTPGDATTAPASPGAKDHDLAPRASFPLTPDRSRINVAKLQDKSKDQLRALLSDPELPAQLGLAVGPLPAASLAAVDGFPPELCGVIFDAINMIVRAKYATLGERAQRLGIPDNLKADGAIKAAKVIDKYAPNSLGKYALEADLGLWIVAVLAANLAIIRAPQAAPVAPAARQEQPAPQETQEQTDLQQFPRSVKM